MGGALVLAAVSVLSAQAELPGVRDGAARWRAALSHRDYRLRDAAQARLESLGYAVLPLLEELTQDLDPEVRARASWVLRSLWEQLRIFVPESRVLQIPLEVPLFASSSVTIVVPGATTQPEEEPSAAEPPGLESRPATSNP